MHCNTCNSVVEENWKFCAYCGTNLSINPDRMAKAIEASVMSALEGTGMKGYAIRVIPSKAPETAARGKKPYFKRQAQTIFLETPNKELAVIEPKTDITRMPGKILLEAGLPGVASSNDVKIMVLSESIEIRAIAPEKMYMKILRIPKNMRLARSAFIEGKLKAELIEIARSRF